MADKESTYQSSRGTIVYDSERDEYRLQEAKLTILGMHDWGKDFHQSLQDREFVAVQFKNQRIEYYLNSNMLSLHRGDVVTVNAAPGHDLGIVVITGWLARRQFFKGRCHDAQRAVEAQELKIVYRRASANDVQQWMHYVGLEQQALVHARSLTKESNLDIKISDVEYQGDGTRLTVYYSSATRIDFRGLVRRLSEELGCKITMRQYNNRQEASVVGGIGACGRPICCSTWLRKLESVVTADIKMQELALHYQRYAGQCEKLKCCLKFELETYAEAKQRFPRLKAPLQLNEGVQLFHVKNDLFRDILWFSTEKKSTRNLVMLTLPQVQQMLERNAKGESGGSLQDFAKQTSAQSKREGNTPSYTAENLNEESITRFDRPSKGNRKNNRKKGSPQGQGSPKTGESPRNGMGGAPNAPHAAPSSNGAQPAKTQQPQQGKKAPNPRPQDASKPQGKGYNHNTNSGKHPSSGAMAHPGATMNRKQPPRGGKPNPQQGKRNPNNPGE